jgi:hypothetical protein
VAAKNGTNKGRGARAPRSQPHKEAASAKQRKLSKAAIRAAPKPLRTAPTLKAVAKKEPAKRKKVRKRAGVKPKPVGRNDYDWAGPVKHLLLRCWTDQVRLSADLCRELSLAVATAASCGFITNKLDDKFIRTWLVTSKGLGWLEASFGANSLKALTSKRKRSIVGPAPVDWQPNANNN